MKKKLIIFLTIILTISCFIKVNAEEITNINENISYQTEASWPKSYIYKGEYEYSIENIELRVYELNSANNQTTTTEENGVITTLTTSPDAEKYLKDEPTKIIPLSPNDFTINPEYVEGKLYDFNTIFINLNLNITKEKLQNLLSNEMNNVTQEISYITEIVVNYKLTKAPEKFKFYMNVNTAKRLFSLFIPDLEVENKITGINQTNSQVINIIDLNLNDNKEMEFNYETTLSETSKYSVFSLNYLAYSEKEEINEDELDDTYQLIMFHNYPNIDYMINNYKRIESNTENEIKDATTSQIVKVENTKANLSIFVYLISFLSIFAGLLLIFFVINNHNKISQNN